VARRVCQQAQQDGWLQLKGVVFNWFRDADIRDSHFKDSKIRFAFSRTDSALLNLC
jgi:hypothetical protein